MHVCSLLKGIRPADKAKIARHAMLPLPDKPSLTVRKGVYRPGVWRPAHVILASPVHAGKTPRGSV